jgi:enterobactin synthetase component D
MSTLQDVAGAALRNASVLRVRLHSGERAPVHVLAFDADRFEAGAFAKAGLAFPPSIAQAVPKRQAEFFFGRLAARLGLQRLDLPAQAVGIGSSREPLWPCGAIGSLTHNRNRAAALVLRTHDVRGVGIDLEAKVSAADRAALLESVVDPAECALLGRLADSTCDFDTLLTLAFSAKESLFKGTFGSVGRYFDFSAARIAGVDAGAGSLTLILQEDLSEDFRSGQHCDAHFQFIDAQTVLTCFSWGAR